MNKVSVLTLSAQAMCANPVSLETTRSQFFIIGKVSLIVNFSKDSHLSSTPESLNFLIKSISFIPPAGGIKDIDLIRKFRDSGVDDKCESFEKLTIKETLPIIKNCDLVVSNDTGFAHIACALKVKTLTLFMDSPVMTYGKYSSLMEVIEPVGEKNTTVHDTLGGDRISFDEVLAKSNLMLN